MAEWTRFDHCDFSGDMARCAVTGEVHPETDLLPQWRQVGAACVLGWIFITRIAQRQRELGDSLPEETAVSTSPTFSPVP